MPPHTQVTLLYLGLAEVDVPESAELRRCGGAVQRVGRVQERVPVQAEPLEPARLGRPSPCGERGRPGRADPVVCKPQPVQRGAPK